MRELRAVVGLLGVTAVLLAASFAGTAASAPASVRPVSDDWPTSLHDTMRTAASRDTHISPASAQRLRLLWKFRTGGPVATTPTVANGIAYFGSWDGHEYAVNATTGRLVWKRYLGVLIGEPDCEPPQAGPSSPATVVHGTLYVGGADGYWYALNARTGAVEWRVWTYGSDKRGAYDGHFNWAGPLIVGNYAYVGVASLGDCPLVQGQLLKVSLTTHRIVATLNLVPDGQVGGGIWTSPAYDPRTGLIFSATGTRQENQPLAQAILGINPATMRIASFWPLPVSQEAGARLDSDFSTSTTLFNTARSEMVVAQNKNGFTYALSRNDVAAGPRWRQYIAVAGISPNSGESTVSSGAFGGGRLYVAGNRGLIGDTEYPGTVRAENPATGRFIWQHGAPGNVIGALAYDNGMVLDGGGSVLEVLDAKTGSRLYSYDTGSQIYAGPSVANGVVYTGTIGGEVLAFRLAKAAAPPANFRVISARASGNVQLTARVDDRHLGTGQAGIELRQSSAADSPYYSVFAQPGTTIVKYRTAFGGSEAVFDVAAQPGARYLMIQRHGDVLDAAVSPDGRAYTLLPGTEATVVLPTRVLAGLLISSRRLNSSISSVGVGAAAAQPPAEPGAHPCPGGWSCEDIGDPLLVGDQTLAGGTWTLSGAGGDIWDVADQFRFVWQAVPSNAVLTAQIAHVDPTSPYAKAGVVMRAGTGASAADYAVLVTAGQGIFVERRYANGAPTDELSDTPGAAPAYVRIVRSGPNFSAETSDDGVTWTPVAGSTVTMPNLAGNLLGGLALSSNNTEKIGSASFTSVAISAQ